MSHIYSKISTIARQICNFKVLKLYYCHMVNRVSNLGQLVFEILKTLPYLLMGVF